MADIEEKPHATLGASGAHRWMECPASVEMEKRWPRSESVYAAEGTLAHHFAEMCLKTGVDARELIDEPGCDELTVDMARYIQEYVDYVRAIPGDLHVEMKVDFSKWVPDGFGTADAIILNDGTAYIVDLKYGKGVRVFAEENPQGMLYALGAYYELSMLYDIKEFVIAIHMPRLDHIDEWSISVEKLIAWAEDRVVPAGKAALETDAEFKPGPKQCRFCGAKDVCKAYTEYTLAEAFEGFEAIENPGELKTVAEMSPSEVAQCLRITDTIKNWANGVQAYAQTLLEQGTDVPGYKLVHGRNSRVWVDPDGASKSLVRKLTKKVAYEEKLISPAAAEKILGKDSKLLERLIETRPGKPTIAEISDRRPAIECNALDGFEAIESEDEKQAA